MYPGNQVFHLKNIKKGKRDQIKTSLTKIILMLDIKDLIVLTGHTQQFNLIFVKKEKINYSSSGGAFKSQWLIEDFSWSP